MAVYNPPTEDLPIFDNNVFTSGNEVLTVDVANKNYLKFPIAQGAETLTDITVLGTSTLNGTLTQNNAILNIDQTDHTNNNLGNNLRATDFYGDVRLLRPSGVNGGSLQFTDITTLPYGNNFTQQYQSGNGFKIINQSLGGSIGMSQKTSGNVLRTPLTLLSTGSTFATTSTDGNNITLACLETVSGKYIGIHPSVTVGSQMPILAGDNQIVSKNQSNTPNTTALVVGCQSTVSNGLKVDSVTNITTIGQGGTSNGVYTTSFSCDGTNSIIKGPAQFTSTSPPTSDQFPLPGPTDSSNKIPTTAWVQSAITSGGIVPLFLRGYKFITNTIIDWPVTFGTIPINFTNGSTLPTNSNFTIRYSIRYDFNITSSTAQSNLFYSAYGNLNIYPNRVSTNTLAVPVFLNGSLNGSLAYGYSDVTVAPRGRYIWTENFSNPEILDGTNRNDNPVFITSVNQASLTLNLGLPYQGLTAPSNNCAISVYLELINDCTGTTITTGSTTFFDSIEKNF